MIYKVEIFNPVTEETISLTVSATNQGIKEIVRWDNQLGVTILMHNGSMEHYAGMPYVAYYSYSQIKSRPAATDAGTPANE